MADHDDELEERFRSLEGVPVPGWRDRVQAKDIDQLQLEPDDDGARRWPPRSALVLVGAAAAVIALLIGVVAWPSDDDEPVASGASTFGDLPPTDASLMCPPALLDVGDLFDDVSPPPQVVTQPATPDGASPYVLQWTQDGRQVTLSYPGPMIRTDDLPPSEDVVLPDGRVAHLEYRANLTADVSQAVADPSDTCGTYWISVAGDGESIEPPAGVGFDTGKGGGSATSVGTEPVVPAATEPIRDLVLDIAATVQIRAPEGDAEVPDVVGLGAIEAQDRLSRAGLVPAGDAPICCDFDDRPIAEQSPTAGETVPIGERVTLRFEAEVTTTTAPPPPVEDVVVPVPEEPIVCPFRRVDISGGVYSEPQVAYDNTIEWTGPEQTTVHLSWPNEMYLEEGHATRELEVGGRPALMHDNGDGQALVYDTGLPDGPCRWIEVAVFGGSSIDRREELAVELATDFITIAEPRFTEAPDASGLSLSAAVDLLARAGFIADWGYSRPIGDEPTPPGSQTVQRQLPPDEDGIVRLEL